MAIETVCQTPDAEFHTSITHQGLSVTVDYGREIWLNETEAALLEANIHNALEMILARYFEPE